MSVFRRIRTIQWKTTEWSIFLGRKKSGEAYCGGLKESNQKKSCQLIFILFTQ